MRTRAFLREMAKELGCSQAEARKSLVAFAQALITGLAGEKYVRLKGLGRFRAKAISGRKIRGFEGEERVVPPYFHVTFSTSRDMRDALRERL